jgi:phage/plasmid-like protein (TIGR03299 family)
MHDIDTTNGIASYADSRQRADGTTDAWHRLGQTIGRPMDPAEALELAHMAGWNVRTIPHQQTYADDSGVHVLAAPGRFTVLRDNPHTHQPEALAVVGSKWQPFQNEATTGLLYDITDQSGAHIETIGALDGGRQTFVTMKMPEHMSFTSPLDGSTDTTDLYLAVLNRHDGEGSLRALVSPVRVVCRNTQKLAERAAVSSVALRHTGDPAGRLAEVRNVLGMTFAYRDTYVEQCERLIAAEREGAWVGEFLDRLFAVEDADSPRQADTRRQHAAGVLAIYGSGSESQAPWYGTAYGVYNAVTEYADHHWPVRGARSSADAADTRALRTLMSPDVAKLKGNAFAALAAS